MAKTIDVGTGRTVSSTGWMACAARRFLRSESCSTPDNGLLLGELRIRAVEEVSSRRKPPMNGRRPFLSLGCPGDDGTRLDSDGDNLAAECRFVPRRDRTRNDVLLPAKYAPNDARPTTRNASKGATPLPSPETVAFAVAFFLASWKSSVLVTDMGEGRRGIGVPGGVIVLSSESEATLLVSLE